MRYKKAYCSYLHWGKLPKSRTNNKKEKVPMRTNTSFKDIISKKMQSCNIIVLEQICFFK